MAVSRIRLVGPLLKVVESQRVEMGIAMCHFELAARALGLAGGWVVREPGIDQPNAQVEYTVSWLGN